MTKPLVRNAADPDQVKKAKDKEKFNREDEILDLKEVLATHSGRRFIWRYLEKCGVFTSSFTGNSETFFKEGSRNIGLQLLADVQEANIESLIEMMKLKGKLNE